MKHYTRNQLLDTVNEKYVLEALNLVNEVPVSEITDMRTRSHKTLITVGIAATLTLALGITVAATNFFGMRVDDANSEETYNLVTPFNNEEDEEFFQNYFYNEATKTIHFDGPSACNRIEYRATSLPEGYELQEPDDLTTWGRHSSYFMDEDGQYTGENNSACIIDADGEPINFFICYTVQFGESGFIFLEETITSIEEEQLGDYCILKMIGYKEGESEPYGDLPGEPYYYECCYYIMQSPEGYIVVLAGQNMDILESIAAGLEFRQTDEVLEYEDFNIHELLVGNWY